MNQATRLKPMQRAMAALEGYFGDQCREFDREWHQRDLSSGITRISDYWEWVVHQIEAGREGVDDVIRVAMTTVQVNVLPIRPVPEESEDQGAAGAYKVAFGKDVSGMRRDRLAAVAMSIFFATHNLASPEDFEVFPVDGAGNQIEWERGHPRGTFADYGTVENVAEPYAWRTWQPTLYVQASTKSDFAQVGWARIEMTVSRIDRIRVHRELCQSQRLSSVSSWHAPDAWSGANQWRPDCQELHVSREDVWFTAKPKCHDSEVRTVAVPIARLLELLATPRDHEVDPSFSWRLGALYYHGTDAEALIEEVADQDENSGA